MRASLVDISRWQGDIDASKIKAAGFCGIVARCTIGWGGSNQPDPLYLKAQKQAKDNGLIFGAYHVIWPANQAPLREAEAFLRHCGLVDFAVIDVELDHGLSKIAVQNQAKSWLEHVGPILNKKLIVYTASWWWTHVAGWEMNYPLWEAEYLISAPRGGVDKSQQPETPNSPDSLAKGWTNWLLWQWTSAGKPVGVKSQSLDYNVYNGTEEQLRQFLELAPAPPTLEERVEALEIEARAHGWNV